jgi:hypothetical protein
VVLQVEAGMVGAEVNAHGRSLAEGDGSSSDGIALLTAARRRETIEQMFELLGGW